MMQRLASVAALAAALVATPAMAEPVHLTILHTNDTHDHLEPFDTKNGKGVGGVARRKTLFDQVRAKEKNVLVLDGGDVFQGTPLFTFFGGEADYKAIAMLNYDGLTVGNHDMDNGLAALQKQAQLLPHPLLSVNLVKDDGTLVFPAMRVVNVGGLKVALVGFMSDDAFQAIAAERRKGLRLVDPVVALNKVVPELRRTCDLVIGLSHSGHEEELKIAAQVPGLDVIIGGHSHTKVDHPVPVKNLDGRTTLVVQAFQWGEYVGRMDLTVDHHRIEQWTGELLPVDAKYAPDPKVAAMVDVYQAQIAKAMDQVVGHTAVEFPNNDKARGDAPIGNLISDAIREETGTDVAFMNSGGIRAPFPKGDVTRGMVYSTLPFENRLVTFKADGGQMNAILNYVASKIGHQGSLQVSGLSMTVDNGKPANVLIGGQPFDVNRTYTISTIDYIANGNDGADVFKLIHEMHPTGKLVRDAMFDYFAKHPMVDTPPAGRLKLLQPAG